MPEKTNGTETAMERFLADEDLFIGHGKSVPTQIILRLRNALMLLAVTLFLFSFGLKEYPSLRAVGYILGALAYFCEIMVLTDCFKEKIPRNGLFMPYCFGPLYIIMGIGCLVG